MRVHSHAKRARKVQRESNRRASSPREEEDRARNLDKADKDGDDGTRRKGGGEEKRKSRVRQTAEARAGNRGRGSGEEHEGESMYASTK